MKKMSHLNMSHGKMSDFLSIPLFGLTLVIKLRNFDFESHASTLIFFDKTNGVRFEYVCPMEKCLILLHVHCLG